MKIELWLSRARRMIRHPPIEIATFIIKQSKKIPRYLLSSRELDESIFLKTYSDQEILDKIKSHAKSKFYFNPLDKNLANLYRKAFREEFHDTLLLAERYMEGKFNLLGKTINFEDWHTANGNKWHLIPSYKIAYYGKNTTEDIKVIWELNRMQFLPILGKAYFLTGDEKYSEQALNYIISWIEENPYLMGVNWMEGIEASMRIYSWIITYYFLLNSPNLTPEINSLILKSVYQHGKFMYDFLSDKWLINNNHIIAELSGLILISLSFPYFKMAKRWLEFSLKKLEKELDKQIFDDGAAWEHSTGYQRFTTELVLYPLILLQKNEYPPPISITKKVERMIEFLNSISIEGGKIPLVGDEDQGFVLKLNDWRYDNIIEVSSTGSVLLNRNDFIRHKSELTFWLFDGKIIKEKQISYGYPSFKIFRDSGYGVFKSLNDYLLFVTSSQDKRHLHAGHRHLDMLSFTYAKNGEFFIVDPGTYTYFADDEMRNRFRGISMHNTITIDNKNPSNLLGLFELYPPPKTKILNHGKLVEDVNFIYATHDGYNPLIHERIVLDIPEGFIVYDCIKGDSKPHKFESYLHLHPKIEIFRISDKEVMLKRDKEKVWVSSDKTFEIINSIHSPKYGIICKSTALKIEDTSSQWKSRIYIMNEREHTKNIAKKVERWSKEILQDGEDMVARSLRLPGMKEQLCSQER